MYRLAIIPARGGSKRIPRKNIKDFLGKPIIAYSINAAQECGLFDEVMVSTDDAEIALVAQEHGAVVPFFRSNDNANDFATLADVVDEVKEQYSSINKSYNHICLILPTAPLLTIENIRKGFSILLDKNADSVRPLVRYSYPIQRAVKMKDGLIEMFNPEHLNTRSQDLEPAFHDAGQFYWMKFNAGLRGNKKIGFEISEKTVQDIDTEEDWELAELKYQLVFR
jgi:N-acylneuraminate cytidylyltransferase